MRCTSGTEVGLNGARIGAGDARAAHVLARRATPLRLWAGALCLALLPPVAAVAQAKEADRGGITLADRTAQPRSETIDAQVTKILGALQIEKLLDLVVEEEILFGEDLRGDMLPDLDPKRWQKVMRAQISSEALLPVFVAAFTKALSDEPDLSSIVALSDAPVMVKAIDLEMKARTLLLDPDIEEAAIARADQARGSARHRALTDYIAALDLVETNVAGSLNSNLTLYRSLAQGGAFEFDVSDQEILSDVAGEAEALRADIETWLMAYLFMAYHPLEDAEFAKLVTLGESPAGRALYHAADKGYEAVFAHNSKALAGLIVARLVGEDL